MSTINRGIEKLVALANLSAEWREKVLAAPLDAVDEAGLRLSKSERAIVASLPSKALETMIDSMAGRFTRPKNLLKTTAAAAAAAFLAGSLAGCDGCTPATRGISPDRPPKKTEDLDRASQGIRLTPEERDEARRKAEEKKAESQPMPAGSRPDMPPGSAE